MRRTPRGEPVPDAPNIVVILSDQHRWDVMSCAGRAGIRTPNLDALAARGTRLSHAFCNSPLCGPSRCSFWTGTHPHTHGGVTHQNERHRTKQRYRPELSSDVTPLPRLFRDAGYATHAIGYLGTHVFSGGKPVDGDPAFWGFETAGMTGSDYTAAVGKDVVQRYNLGKIQGEMWEPAYANVEGEPFPHGEEKMWDRLMADEAVRYLDHADADRPFLMYCGFRAPHTPWCAPEKFHAMYDPDNPADVGPLPDFRYRHENKPRRLMERFDYFDIRHYRDDMVRRSIAAYFAMVSMVDAYVGEILDALDRNGQRDNTLIVFASDHGENLYQHGLCEKHTLLESSVRVPMIVAGPDLPDHGGTSDELVSLIDVVPTLCHAAGIEPPASAEGVDFRPALHGEPVRDDVRCEYYHSLDPCRMIRDKRFKYIHTEDDICELYDLEQDPEERVNLAWYPHYARRIERMDREVMSDWEVPDVPLYAMWGDLNERKQKQRLRGEDIIDTRPYAQPPFPPPPIDE